MSARAIRALRGGIEPIVAQSDDNDSSDGDDEESVEGRKMPASAFALMDSSDDEDDESSSESSSEPPETQETEDREKNNELLQDDTAEYAEKLPAEDIEEDLDALLDEFKEKDHDQNCGSKQQQSLGTESERSQFYPILNGIDPSDLDIDFSTRNTFRSSSSAPAARRKGRQTFLFGPAREGWGRPPHYVGGGIGMDTYDREQERSRPWPYSERQVIDGAADADQDKTWVTFKHSSSVKQDLRDYETIKQSGDLNALVIFVAHHPFVVDALLQLATVLYQANHTHEGLALLRRCLWVFECSSLINFGRDLSSQFFLDIDQPENGTYFKAMAKLIQVSNIASLPRTALAVSRFALSLDPLRDPLGVLLTIDSHALNSNSGSVNQWLVDLVESQCLDICYTDPGGRTFSGSLFDLPNFAFSYAFALYRLFTDNDEDEEQKMKADSALQAAIGIFPSIVGMILQVNEVDTTGRSFRRDWVSVLGWCTERAQLLRNAWLSSDRDDLIFVTSALQACDLISNIFVKQKAASLWGSDEVQQWLFDNVVQLQTTNPDLPEPPSPAICRYANCDPTNYDDRIQLLPAEANLIDPNMLAQAMVVDTNRPRMLRRMPGVGGNAMDGAFPHQQGPPVFGGPPTNIVDPDWPLAEVFWRSLLPWNHVEGVPPAPRD